MGALRELAANKPNPIQSDSNCNVTKSNLFSILEVTQEYCFDVLFANIYQSLLYNKINIVIIKMGLFNNCKDLQLIKAVCILALSFTFTQNFNNILKDA